MSQDYRALLPLHGHLIKTPKGSWRAKVTNYPEPPPNGTVLLYALESEGTPTRRLNLYVPMEKFAIQDISGESCYDAAKIRIEEWLESKEGNGELDLYGVP
jgi:hypothetical protein